jgi:RNA polymerase sigma-70 factor, ECF subfamily
MKTEDRPVDVAELAALGKLFEQHRPQLLLMVRQRLDPALASRLDAEGILAQAYLRAQKRWEAYKASGIPAYPWLYRQVLDCLCDEYDHHTCQRRNLRLEVPWPDASASQLALGLVGHGTSPSAAFSRKELQERMTQALEMLRPDDREILCMRFFDGLTSPEMALVLTVEEAAVRKRYSRALRRLRDLWQKLFADEGSRP